LGVRHFNPRFAERSTGIRAPFHRWLIETLDNFGLDMCDFYSSASDAGMRCFVTCFLLLTFVIGADVKAMMNNELQLKWEWCIPHLTNAATKAAFGMSSRKMKNPLMMGLIDRMSKTVQDIKRTEITGI
jgi:hypothetical protein